MYIYVLTKFQSTVDKSIPVRMLLYIIQLYDLLLRNSKKGKLPAVFPFCFTMDLMNGQYRIFSIWIKKLIQLKEEGVEKIIQLSEVKSMLVQLADSIKSEGIQISISQGIKTKAIEDAKKMKDKNYPLNDIVEITSLSLEELQKL